MKKQYLSWCVLGLSLFLYQNAALAEQMYGVFMVTKGSVKIQSAKTGTSDAKVGVKVYEGDTIITAADSRAKIVMSDRNVINVNPESKLQIAKYENDAASGKKNVELNLLEGKVRNNVEQTYDGEKSKFLIKTPTAVAGVRGTQFLAGYNPSTQMTSIVTFKGAVTVASVGPKGQIIGSAVLVKKGEMTTASPNSPPEPPKAMPKEEVKKMDVETASTSQTPNEMGSQNREVASDVAAPAKEAVPPMIDKKDMDPTMAKDIKDPRSVPVAAPTQTVPRTTASDITAVKDILRDTMGKTRVIVRPQPVGN
ncbi:FecR domain-containing protein [Bdellovibrio bacteriovorus]|uniref:FecR family protein n=1 Tax=Bdellovibrio TaxID=958 RepID=UPI0035A92333